MISKFPGRSGDHNPIVSRSLRQGEVYLVLATTIDGMDGRPEVMVLCNQTFGWNAKVVGKIGAQDVCLCLGLMKPHILVLCKGRFGWIEESYLEAVN